jgi:hypothetical protein
MADRNCPRAVSVAPPGLRFFFYRFQGQRASRSPLATFWPRLSALVRRLSALVRRLSALVPRLPALVPRLSALVRRLPALVRHLSALVPHQSVAPPGLHNSFYADPGAARFALAPGYLLAAPVGARPAPSVLAKVVVGATICSLPHLQDSPAH